jgi:hypothetical protein
MAANTAEATTMEETLSIGITDALGVGTTLEKYGMVGARIDAAIIQKNA